MSQIDPVSLFNDSSVKSPINEHIISPDSYNDDIQNKSGGIQSKEKHNAEKLVECANQKKNVFQFDTLTPKKKLCKSDMPKKGKIYCKILCNLISVVNVHT